MRKAMSTVYGAKRMFWTISMALIQISVCKRFELIIRPQMLHVSILRAYCSAWHIIITHVIISGRWRRRRTSNIMFSGECFHNLISKFSAIKTVYVVRSGNASKWKIEKNCWFYVVILGYKNRIAMNVIR